MEVVQKRQVYVGIADVIVSRNQVNLYTVVGSCIAVCIYDPVKHIGGMVHVMLPEMSLFKSKEPPTKFADVAVPQLIAKMESEGGKRSWMTAKLAGGANVLKTLTNGGESIGQKNFDATVKALVKERVRIADQDVLGNKARTVLFNIENGVVDIKFAQVNRSPNQRAQP